MDGNLTIIQQGSFISDGSSAKTITLRDGIDWMEVYNLTQTTGTTITNATKFYWQAGMGSTSLMEYHNGNDHVMANNTAANTFTYIDLSTYTGGAFYATTAYTDATQPVVSTGTTTGLVVGAIVRMKNTVSDLDGQDFSISAVNPGVSFTLGNTLQHAPGVAVVPGTAAYKLVAPNLATYKLIKPSIRNISNITRAANAVVTTLVDHGYAIGQKVIFHLSPQYSSAYGMVEIDGLTGTVTAVSAVGAYPQTFTVDIDSTGFTAFTFPTAATATATPYTPAQVESIGEATNIATSEFFDDTVKNQGYIGMILAPGVQGPAGGTNLDVIYWKAGKSFNT